MGLDCGRLDLDPHSSDHVIRDIASFYRLFSPSAYNKEISLYVRFWWAGLLDLGDLQLVDPGRGAVLAKLHQLGAAKQAILADESLSEDEKAEKVSFSSKVALASLTGTIVY